MHLEETGSLTSKPGIKHVPFKHREHEIKVLYFPRNKQRNGRNKVLQTLSLSEPLQEVITDSLVDDNRMWSVHI